MSDYLTRLVQRSFGFPPQIEPLIAPLHSPLDPAFSDQAETSTIFESDRPAATIETSHEKTESSATFESDRPAATIKTSPKNTSPEVVPDVRGTALAPSSVGNQPPSLESPLPAQAELPIQRKDDHARAEESRPKTSAPPTLSAPPVEAVDTVTVAPSGVPPPPDVKFILAPETPEAAVQPEITVPRELTTSSLAPTLKSVAQETPLLPRPSPTASARTLRNIGPTEIIGFPKPMPPRSVTAPESWAPKPIVPAPAFKKTAHIAGEPGPLSPLKPAAFHLIPARPSSNAPPTIHVTIGRVEVRAVLPPSTKPKVEPSAAPKVSLEDYLKQRNGGRS
jgi:hypothetical protein